MTHSHYKTAKQVIRYPIFCLVCPIALPLWLIRILFIMTINSCNVNLRKNALLHRRLTDLISLFRVELSLNQLHFVSVMNTPRSPDPSWPYQTNTNSDVERQQDKSLTSASAGAQIHHQQKLRYMDRLQLDQNEPVQNVVGPVGASSKQQTVAKNGKKWWCSIASILVFNQLPRCPSSGWVPKWGSSN